MPVIKVWRLTHKDMVVDDLNGLYRTLLQAVVGMEVLGLNEKQITCIFPTDSLRSRFETEIIIEVTGLFAKPERTDEVRRQLATTIGTATETWWREMGFKKPIVIECLVHPFVEEQGYWSSIVAEAETNRQLHIDVVVGTIQILRFLHENDGREMSLSSIYNVGKEGKSDKASGYLMEFCKDGIVNLPPGSIKLVMEGDYTQVWANTNRFLKFFGHAPIEPEPVQI